MKSQINLKKMLVLMVGLSLLTSYVMAQSIVSSTTIDAKGDLAQLQRFF